MDCPFCALIRRETEADIVHESEHAMAFLDKTPLAPGHVLVVPKRHIDTIFTISDADLAALSRFAKEVAHKLQQRGAHGVNILHASGTAAQQSVHHFHFHLVPRYENDGKDLWPKTDSHKNH